MQAYAGIDVAFAKRKMLPVSLCFVNDGRLIPLRLACKSVPEPPRAIRRDLGSKTFDVETILGPRIDFMMACIRVNTSLCCAGRR
jgi:hypothetical protein